jgi:hypothetical protein
MPVRPDEEELVTEYRQDRYAGDAVGARAGSVQNEIIRDLVALPVREMVEIDLPAAVRHGEPAAP